jgi:hypothetical protein
MARHTRTERFRTGLLCREVGSRDLALCQSPGEVAADCFCRPFTPHSRERQGAEGTSSDGNRILPFRSSLFSAASLAPPAANDNGLEAVVQTVAITYTHLHGLPILRHERPLVAWYGEMDMLSHAWNVLKSGPLDVTICISEPVMLASLRDRKALAAFSEAQVRRDYVAHLTSRHRAA